MSEKIGVLEFYKLSRSIPIIDVRSPGEFETGHIPGAYNIPIFTNEERAIVGTIYKKQGKEPSVLKGLEIVGTKLRTFADTARKLSVDNKILVHCWRGGMRSASMAWLFETVGINTFILEGGYKAFRKYGKEQLANSKLIVLGGLTGSGKTETLLEIRKNGEQVVDLEGLAHHKGSAFGALGQEAQPTNEQFENDLLYQWLSFGLSKPVWVEDESHSIGSNWLPSELYSLMRISPVIKMEIDKNFRIKRLMNEYASFNNNKLEQCILRIGKKLGGQNVKKALESLENDNLEEVANITLAYYDKSYDFGLNKRENQTVFPIKLESDNPEENAKKIISFAKRAL